MDIKEKGKADEVYKSELQDIHHLDKTLASMKADNESESAFLKKQVLQLINDRIRLQQHVISLSSRVNNTAFDVFEEGGS